MQSIERTGHIFLSYPSVDRDFAHHLAADLINLGVDVWMDQFNIAVGDDWEDSIQHAITDNCAGLIAILSTEYTESSYCKKEIKRANSLNLPIFPVLLRQVESKDWPITIQSHQYLDFCQWHDERLYDNRLSELVQALYDQSTAQIGSPPDAEKRYLIKLIAQLSAYKGLLEYVELSGIIDPPNTRLQTIHERSVGLAVLEGKPKIVQSEIIWQGVRQKPLAHISEALREFPCFVLIGEPGAGKTTILRRLVLDAARARLADPDLVPLPLLLQLPRWENSSTPEDFIRRNWRLPGDPIPLIHQGKVLLYLDGLNEMGANGAEKAENLCKWLRSETTLPRAIITCRTHDYIRDFDLKVPTVLVKEMNTLQIQDFAENYLADKAEGFLRQIQLESLSVFNEAYSISQLARNPYLLAGLILVYQHTPNRRMPTNSGDLFRQLVRKMWDMESIKGTPGWIPFQAMEEAFSHLAFAMIDEGRPIDVPLEYVKQHIHSEELLRAAQSANFIMVNDNQVRFYHQLMQEYFAAVRLGNIGVKNKLERRGFDYDWDLNANFKKWGQVLRALCGIVDKPDTVINQVIRFDVFLAAHCLDSGIFVSDRVRRKITTHLLWGLRNIGPYAPGDFIAHSAYRPFLHALSKTGDTLAAEELALYLYTNGDYVVRDDASIGLLKMAPRLAVPALKKALESLQSDQKDWAYDGVISTLLSIQDSSMVPIIAAALRGKETKKRWRILRFLASAPLSSHIKQGLLNALNISGGSIREYAEKQLKEIEAGKI